MRDNYFGEGTASKILQHKVENILEPAFQELQMAISEIDCDYVQEVPAKESAELWNGVCDMIDDKIEYYINYSTGND